MGTFRNFVYIRRTSIMILTRRCHGPAPAAAVSAQVDSTIVDEFKRLCYERDLPKAMRAMELMEKCGLYADAVTYSELIKNCVARRALEDGKRVHRHVCSNGPDPKTFLLNVFINMYVKFGMLEDARKVFDKMPERNVVSWTTMISAFTNADMSYNALEFFVQMIRNDVKPNMFTFSSVLRACESSQTLKQLHCATIKPGLESDVFIRSSLIDSYSKCGELQTSLKVFNEMETLDAVVWNSIIGSFAQNNEGDKALNLFKRMKRAGFVANQASLTSVLRSCTSLSLLELGRQVHVHILKHSSDLILDNALVDMYCKSGSLEDAKDVFTQMPEKDVISWSTMVAGLAQNGYSTQALNLFHSMKENNIKPNYITLLGVLFACSHAGLLNDGWYYFRSMRTLYNIEPGREHYGCMIDLLGRSGKLKEAMKLIQVMKSKPDAITWRILLASCRVHKNPDLATHAAKQILKLDPSDIGTYILLSNIYANSERWDDVTLVRNTMRDRGVKKEPGCSWIEVDTKIHCFISGDESHALTENIRTELNVLMEKVRVLGYIPDTDFVLQDLEGEEQREDSLRYHSEKLAVVFGLMTLTYGKTVRIRKNLRICGDCHLFVKLVAKMMRRRIVIRDPIRYHHFSDGICSCGDYW